ncbi:MAG: DUF554 domain-containing protein [Bacillota bacterium]|nr:DUF554 domain-containing protein [Bacillota bacterium]
MRGLGTLANFIAVIIGSGLGLIFKGGLKPKMQSILMQAGGLAVIFIGIEGAAQGLLGLKGYTTSSILLVLSLAIGGVLGEAIDIEEKFERIGERLKKAVRAEGDANFVEGFVTASLVICVGAMAIVGSLEDGLTGNASTLYVKSILDLIIVMVFASSLGIGTMFSALSILIYQGLITALAVFIKPFISDGLVANLSCVGAVLVFAVGINLTLGKKFKVGNLLPALIVPVIYEILLSIRG